MPVKVFFNNSCNICKLEIDHYKKNSDENLEWVDITNNQQAVDLTSKSKEELLRRLHVIDNGQVIGGAPPITCPLSITCLLYTSPSPRDVEESRMPSSA